MIQIPHGVTKKPYPDVENRWISSRILSRRRSFRIKVNGG